MSATAQAATYSFNFLANDSSYGVIALVSVLDVLNGVGGHDITSITGTVTGIGGGSISALVANPNQPTPTTAFGFLYDNVNFPSTDPVLNTNGVLFDTANGQRWNLWGVSAGVYELYTYAGPVLTTGVDKLGTMAVAAVPEPETFAMLLAGLGLMGAIARRRKVPEAA